MGKEKFIISSIIILALAVNLVSAIETTPASSEYSFWSGFLHTFSVGDFSVVGNNRQCSQNPSYEHTFAYNSLMQVNAATYCSSGYGLIDMWLNDWYHPYGEFKNSISFYCGAVNGCIVQVYCCPHDECTSDSQCVSWYGTGSNCVSKTANDPNIIYKDANLNPLSSFRYCATSQQQIVCYYYPGSGSTCTSSASTTYYGTTCPASYMGHTLYSSKSVCENNIQASCNVLGASCGGPSNLPSGKPCCSGLDCQNFQCVSTGNCTTGQEKCGIIGNPNQAGKVLYKCVSGTWQSQGQLDGKCGYVACGGTDDSCSSNSDCCSPLICGGGFLGIGKSCRVDYSGGNGGVGNQKSMTKGAFEEATSEMIAKSMCDVNDDCSKSLNDIYTEEGVYVEDHNWTIRCVSSNSIKETNKESFSYYLKMKADDGGWFDSWSGFWSKLFSTATSEDYQNFCEDTNLRNLFLSLGTFFVGGETRCEKMLNDMPSGTCRAEIKSSGSWLSMFAWFDVNGDGYKNDTDAIIIIIVLIVSVVIIKK
jgi:hypothetical protein